VTKTPVRDDLKILVKVY